QRAPAACRRPARAPLPYGAEEPGQVADRAIAPEPTARPEVPPGFLRDEVLGVRESVHFDGPPGRLPPGYPIVPPRLRRMGKTGAGNSQDRVGHDGVIVLGDAVERD